MSELASHKEVGVAEGEAKFMAKFAKAVLLDGDSIEKVAKTTGLAIAEIENLKFLKSF